MVNRVVLPVITAALIYAIVAHYRTASDFNDACAAYASLGDMSFSDDNIGNLEIDLSGVLGIVKPEDARRLRDACGDRLQGEHSFLDDLFRW